MLCLWVRIRFSSAGGAASSPPGSKRGRELTIPNPLRVLTGVLIELSLKFRKFGRTTPGTRSRPEEADEATGKPAQSSEKAKERSQTGHHTPPDIYFFDGIARIVRTYGQDEFQELLRSSPRRRASHHRAEGL
jgi:hypothetical protein